MIFKALQTMSAWHYRIRGISALIGGGIFLIIGAIIALTNSVSTGLILGAVGLIMGGVSWLYFISAKRIQNGLPPLIRPRRNRIRIGK